MDTKILEHCSFIVLRDHTLTVEEQKILTHLYMPLIGPRSLNIYMTLGTFINQGDSESIKNGHLKLFQMLQVHKESEFIKSRNELEAVGLLSVYTSGDIYVYTLNRVLSPEEFFKNDVLKTFLYQKVGETEFQNIMCEFLVHQIDLSMFKNITKSFDDVFEIDDNQGVNYLTELNSLLTLSSGDQVKVNNPHFDYQYFNVLINALDVIDSELISSRYLYDLVNRYSFLYQLTTEEIKDAIIASVQVSGNIDEELFKKTCKKIYDGHAVKPKIVKTKTSNNDDKLISLLEQSSPNVIVQNLFGVGLVGSEIEMFDRILNTTGISLGILNVLIIYVLQDKQGEVPSYNYFDKIIKTWQRMGISSTKEAMDYINGRRTAPKSTRSKVVKDVPDWYDDYIKDVETKQNTKLNQDSEEKTMQELNELFKFNKR